MVVKMEKYNVMDELNEALSAPRSSKMAKGMPKGQQAAQHDYISRTGGPGSYVYTYADENGEIYTTNQDGKVLSGHKKDRRLGDKEPAAPKLVVMKKKETTVESPGKPLDGTLTFSPQLGDTSAAEADLSYAGMKAVHGEFKPKKAASEGTKELAKIAEVAHENFLSGNNFKEITKGELGRKGLTTIGGKTYFVKSDKGGHYDLDSVLKEQGIERGFTGNQNEIGYYNIVAKHFPHLENYYVKKHAINDSMMVAEGMDFFNYTQDEKSTMIMEAAEFQEGKRKDLHQLAAVNYLLGNVDRHGENIEFDRNGDMKLIDEGLAFTRNYDYEDESTMPIVGVKTPFYVRTEALGSENNMPLNDLKEILTPEAQSGILRMVKDPAQKKDIKERFETLKNYVNNPDSINEAIEDEESEAYVPIENGMVNPHKFFMALFGPTFSESDQEEGF